MSLFVNEVEYIGFKFFIFRLFIDMNNFYVEDKCKIENFRLFQGLVVFFLFEGGGWLGEDQGDQLLVVNNRV